MAGLPCPVMLMGTAHGQHISRATVPIRISLTCAVIKRVFLENGLKVTCSNKIIVLAQFQVTLKWLLLFMQALFLQQIINIQGAFTGEQWLIAFDLSLQDRLLNTDSEDPSALKTNKKLCLHYHLLLTEIQDQRWRQPTTISPAAPVIFFISHLSYCNISKYYSCLSLFQSYADLKTYH